MFKSILKYLWYRLNQERGANETTTTTVTEMIPTIVEAALLELDDGSIIRPLVRNVPFPGPGVVHQTPFVTKLTAETDTNLANQALDTSGSLETSPSEATVGEHGATILIKDLAQLGSVGDLAAIGGQLIGQCLVVRQEVDLATLFASFTPNQGDANEDIVVADVHAAYLSLREGITPLPYSLVLTPGQFWGTKGLIQYVGTTAARIESSSLGTVQEDVMRNGWTAKILGFDVYTTANITVTSNNASGAAFGRDAIKFVDKQGIRMEVDRDLVGEVGDRITATGFWGEAILRNRSGTEMQFNEVT